MITPSVVAEPDLKISYYVACILHHIHFLEPCLRAEDKFVFGLNILLFAFCGCCCLVK